MTNWQASVRRRLPSGEPAVMALTSHCDSLVLLQISTVHQWAFQLQRTRLRAYQFCLRLVLHDVSGNSTGRDCVRARKIHLSRTAAAGEVPVLGADHHLVRACRDAGTGIDTCAATWLDDNRAGFAED